MNAALHTPPPDMSSIESYDMSMSTDAITCPTTPINMSTWHEDMKEKQQSKNKHRQHKKTSGKRAAGEDMISQGKKQKRDNQQKQPIHGDGNMTQSKAVVREKSTEPIRRSTTPASTSAPAPVPAAAAAATTIVPPAVPASAPTP